VADVPGESQGSISVISGYFSSLFPGQGRLSVGIQWACTSWDTLSQDSIETLTPFVSFALFVVKIPE